MGLGRFGGGVGVCRYLAEQGARVTATDLRDVNDLAPSIRRLADLIDDGRVTLRLGEHDEHDFTDTDLVVASPAVPAPWKNPFLDAARARGVPLTTEIALLIDRLPTRERVIGVTGSAGKSTTASLIGHVINHATDHRAHVGGNLGGSLLGSLRDIEPHHWVVLELSSFQLHWLGAVAGDLGAGARLGGVSVVTNLAANHLDWHGSIDHYRISKQQILRLQPPSGRAVLDESVAGWLGADGARPKREGDRVVTAADAAALPRLRVPGSHNRSNAALAVAALHAAGIAPPAERLAEALRSFRGLPHRLELLGVFRLPDGRGEVRAFNDSKSTTPEATALAVGAFDQPGEVGAGRVRLIAGGYDKGAPLDPLLDAGRRCARVYAVGSTGPAIAAALDGDVARAGILERAVRAASADATDGDVLLLSPGCASWDQFPDYEVRGRTFRRAISEELGEPIG